MVQIKLTQKFASHIRRISPSAPNRAGEIIDLPNRDAKLLLAQGWAEFVSPHETDKRPTDEQATDDARAEESGPYEAPASSPDRMPLIDTAASLRKRRPPSRRRT